MTAEAQARAVELTRLVVAVPGVRGIYPQSVIAAAVSGLVRSAHSPATGLLEIRRTAGATAVVARLAIDSDVRSEEVIGAVHAVLLAAIPVEPFELDIEIAHIE